MRLVERDQLVIGVQQLLALGRNMMSLTPGMALWISIGMNVSFILVGIEGRKMVVARCA